MLLADGPITDALADRAIATDLIDHCQRRLTILPPDVTTEALDRPATRRLHIARAGYFVDDHGHLVSVPDGTPHHTLMVCVGGEAWVRVDDRHYVVTPGTVFVIPAGRPHAFVGRDRPWAAWWCTLQGSEVSELLTEIGITPINPVIRIGNRDQVVSVIEEITDAYERDRSLATASEASAAGWRLLSRLDSPAHPDGPADPLTRAVQYLAERFRSDVRIPELAALVGVSPYRLSALFRDATGAGVLAYLIGVRMSEARRLLTESSLAIAEVGKAVGYDDPYYFSREFSRRHGLSPTRFRDAASRDVDALATA